MFSRVVRGAFGTCWLLSAEACTGVVSLDPTIGPEEAISVPRLLGDWVNVDEVDSTQLIVRPGPESTSYIVEFGDPVIVGSVSLGRPKLSVRVTPAGGGLLAEAIPWDDDPSLDSLGRRYGAMVQLVYIVVVVKFVGDDLQLAGLDGSHVRDVLDARHCPPRAE